MTNTELDSARAVAGWGLLTHPYAATRGDTNQPPQIIFYALPSYGPRKDGIDDVTAYGGSVTDYQTCTVAKWEVDASAYAGVQPMIMTCGGTPLALAASERTGSRTSTLRDHEGWVSTDLSNVRIYLVGSQAIGTSVAAPVADDEQQSFDFCTHYRAVSALGEALRGNLVDETGVTGWTSTILPMHGRCCFPVDGFSASAGVSHTNPPAETVEAKRAIPIIVPDTDEAVAESAAHLSARRSLALLRGIRRGREGSAGGMDARRKLAPRRAGSMATLDATERLMRLFRERREEPSDEGEA